MGIELGNTTRLAYRAEMELAFLYNNIRLDIIPERIKFLVIDSNYDSEVMPKIYFSISVDTKLYNLIIMNKSSARFHLKLKRKNVFSKSYVSKAIIDDVFSYIPSASAGDYNKDISQPNDDSYKNIIIGLISVSITEKLRKTFNGIYNNIDQNTLVSLALEDTESIIQPLTYNHKYDSILIPPITSRYRFLKFIFDYDNFYDTDFLYFMDFQKSYLLSRDGNSMRNSDDNINDIYIDIKKLNDRASYYDGIDIINNSYYLYINPVNSNVITPDSIEKISNQIVAYDDDNDLQILDLNINNSYNASIKQMFARVENGSIIKNNLESVNTIIEISKKDIDGFLFTPNKSYVINYNGDYKQHSGQYMIIGKKEFYTLTSGKDFSSSVYLIFRKINQLSTRYSKSSKEINIAVKSSTQTFNTADIINNIKITKVQR